MNSATQGKPREHSYLIQFHMEQDGRMPIKATTAWLCTLHMKHRSQFYCSWASFRTGKKKKNQTKYHELQI